MDESPPKSDGIPPLDIEEPEKPTPINLWISGLCHWCCDGVATNVHECMICRRLFCKTHVSSSDLDLCHECAAEPNRDPTPIREFAESTVTIGPLIDDEGVRHTGKLITPVGDTFVASRYIDSLSDEQQEEMLMEYRAKVQEAEKLLYSHTIVASTVKMAISERKRKKRIQDHAARIVRTPQGKQIVLPGRQTGPRVPQKVGIDAVKERIASMSKEEKKAFVAKLFEVLKSK
jgi:hypothetical protein